MTPIEKHIEFDIKFHDSSLVDRNALEESATAILRRIKVTEVKSAGSTRFFMREQDVDICGYGVLEDTPKVDEFEAELLKLTRDIETLRTALQSTIEPLEACVESEKLSPYFHATAHYALNMARAVLGNGRLMGKAPSSVPKS